MKKLSYVCDRCGKESEQAETIRRQAKSSKELDLQADLCSQCWNELLNFGFLDKK